MPLGCCSFSNADLILLLMICCGGAFGIAFFTYLPFSLITRSLAQVTNPHKTVDLFVAMLFSYFGWIGATWGTVFLLINSQSVKVAIAMMIAGFVGWCFLFFSRISKSPTLVSKEIRITKLQAWCQDLIIAALSFGLVQAIVLKTGLVDVIPAVIYLFIGSALGLLTALNVCRYQTSPIAPLNRALLVAFIVCASSITLFVPLFVEWRWRRQLNKMGLRFKTA